MPTEFPIRQTKAGVGERAEIEQQ